MADSMDKKVLADMLAKLSASGVNKADISKGIDSGKADKLLGMLGKEDAERVRRTLADKEATKRLLSSPEAQELIRRLGGGK